MSDGFLISFEGGEGAGKTTQINRLADLLTKEGRKVITTREPGGTPEGEKIRNLLVQRDGGNWEPMAEFLLFLAARIMHIENVIKPALENGKIVITDRFTDSTVAYQGYGHGLSLDEIKKISRAAVGDFAPDLTFVLDIDPEAGLHRSGRRLASESLKLEQIEDRYEGLELAFHQRLREGFLKIAAAEPQRCRVIDASQEVDTITEQIQTIIMDEINNGPVRRGSAA